MKRKILLPAAIIALGVAVSSCGTYKESTNKVLPVIVNEVVTTPKMIDYKIDFNKRITGTASGKVAGKLSMKKYLTPEYYLELATTNAIKSGNADFLVEPTVDRDIKKKKITISVTGYAANYTGTTDIDLRDTIMVQSYVILSEKNTNALHRVQGTGGEQFARGGLFKRMKKNLNRQTIKSNQIGL